MKRLFFALALACALSSPAVAGDIPCGSPAPTSSGITESTKSTEPGEIPSGGATSVWDVELSAVLAVFSSLA